MASLFYDFYDEEFEYDVDKEDEIRKQLKKYDKEKIIDLLLDFIDWDELWDYFEEEIYDDNENAAKEAYEDAELYAKDPLGYYGLSRSDFY